ncbi:hypothetical protein Acr_03g0004040 [Actinidia rufa]|uniref:Uncharacterized protein n=1 Tax=Actinidia rufa TaxID=165716 RepID=A0A7J0EB60_9ERIC|nr:hypothetical protein Acr_03g0004040 [Actinidia rufa]
MLLPSDINTAKSTPCPSCNTSMSKKVAYVARTTANEVSEGKGGFVQGVVTYMVMDDLVVKPMSGISSITLLNKFNVKDLSALEEKVVDFGMDESISDPCLGFKAIEGIFADKDRFNKYLPWEHGSNG